jgi:hypothetical protein
MKAVEGWITEDPELNGKEISDAEADSEECPAMQSLRTRGLGLLAKLKVLDIELDNAKWELSLRGVRQHSGDVTNIHAHGSQQPWPADEYVQLSRIQRGFLAALVQLAQAFKLLTPQWRKDFARRSALLNPNLVC